MLQRLTQSQQDLRASGIREGLAEPGQRKLHHELTGLPSINFMADPENIDDFEGTSECLRLLAC